MSTQYPPVTQSGPAGEPGNYGPPAPAPQGTDTVSILGLVFAFLFWPIGLILSIIGLTRTGKGKRAGRGLAIAGLVVSLLAGVIAIAVIATIASAADEAATEIDAATEQFEEDMAELEASAEALAPSAPAPAGDAAAEEVAVALGQPATVGGVTFTVNSEECGATQVGDDTFGVTAQGTFCFFNVTVLNGSTEPFFFDSSSVTGYLGEAEYSADGEAGIYLPDNDAFLEEINPGNTVAATVVFDVPAGAQLDRLELSPGFLSSERAVVNLR